MDLRSCRGPGAHLEQRSRNADPRQDHSTARPLRRPRLRYQRLQRRRRAQRCHRCSRSLRSCEFRPRPFRLYLRYRSCPRCHRSLRRSRCPRSLRRRCHRLAHSSCRQNQRSSYRRLRSDSVCLRLQPRLCLRKTHRPRLFRLCRRGRRSLNHWTTRLRMPGKPRPMHKVLQPPQTHVHLPRRDNDGGSQARQAANRDATRFRW